MQEDWGGDAEDWTADAAAGSGAPAPAPAPGLAAPAAIAAAPATYQVSPILLSHASWRGWFSLMMIQK